MDNNDWLVTSYSNEAMAGMGIAKKIDMIAFSVVQCNLDSVLFNAP